MNTKFGELLAKHDEQTGARVLGAGNVKLEEMLKNLRIAMSRVPKKANGDDVNECKRRESLPADLVAHKLQAESDENAKEEKEGLKRLPSALKHLRAALPTIRQQALLSWAPETRTLGKNVSKDQASTLNILQDALDVQQERIVGRVEMGLQALVTVERIFDGFKEAMQEEEWMAFGSVDQYFVVKGLLDSLCSALGEVERGFEVRLPAGESV